MMLLRGTLAVLILASPLATQATDTKIPIARMDEGVTRFLEVSLPRMACNLSPTQWPKGDIVAAPGSIIASPSQNQPDYFFHWVRDSSIIARTLTRFYPRIEGTPSGDFLRRFLSDYLRFSARLQHSESKWGLGETRFNVDGSLDEHRWARPQNDGPALRALAAIEIGRTLGEKMTPEEGELVRQIVRNDIEYVAAHVGDVSYDLWEFIKGDHFYTDLVQLTALEEVALAYPSLAPAGWFEAATDLRARLARHWDADHGVYVMTVGPAYDEDDTLTVPPGSPPGLDSSIIMAMQHARSSNKAPIARDARVLATADRIEQFFVKEFPVNARDDETTLGPAIGRHFGDGYFGGNAFYFLTGAYAHLYYTMAKHEQDEARQPIKVDPLATSFYDHLYGERINAGKVLSTSRAGRANLVSLLKRKGDAFLNTMLRSIPENGEVAEQFSKQNGDPASATDLTWSYAAILDSILDREEVTMSTVDFSRAQLLCAKRKPGARMLLHRKAWNPNRI